MAGIRKFPAVSPFQIASCFTLLTVAAAQGGEVTIEERPFAIEAVFQANVMPEGEVKLLEIDAKTWEDFRLVTLAEHGSNIDKGGLLAGFDAEGIDRKLEDTRRSVASGTLTLAGAEHELKVLTETAPDRLDAARRAAEIAKEENAYFTQTRRKAEEEAADQRLNRSRQQLENQKEELRQLTRMYEADDLTEETEEIILTRQKDDVAVAEFALRMATLDRKRSVEVSLPREAVTLANSERDTALALRNAEEEIPRAIELKKLELETLKTNLARDKQTLAEMEQDRPLFEFKAPTDGIFYHGPIENGRWTTGDLMKSLVTNGRPPVRRPFATFIPSTTKLAFVGFPNEATARPLAANLAGTATFAGREELEIPVQTVRVSAAPEPDGTYRTRLSAEWPKEFKPAVGSSAQIRLVSYQKEKAIVIPTKALVHGPKGWTVELMLADGKTERRPVKRGRSSGEETEILGGLEIGQVILAP